MLTLPNCFTVLRLLLAPVIIIAIVQHHAFAALSVFAVAAATDALDGYLARRLNSVTPAGAFLDPIADKVLLTGVYLALALAESVPWWLVCVIFARDLLILASSALALLTTKIRAFPPSSWGKASTFFQILTAVAFLGRDAFFSPLLDHLSVALVWPTLALTVWSGIHYGWRGARLLRAN